MDVSQELEEALIELKKADLKVKGVSAKKYLYNLWETATFKSSVINGYEEKLFEDLWMIDFEAKEGRLVEYIREKAFHFRDVGDSGNFPDWKNDAYISARIYQEYYNKMLKI